MVIIQFPDFSERFQPVYFALEVVIEYNYGWLLVQGLYRPPRWRKKKIGPPRLCTSRAMSCSVKGVIFNDSK